MNLPLSFALAAWVSLAAGFAARAETWTNVAGQVVTARLVGIQGEHVLLQRANGRTLRVPLSSLKPADRVRAREQTGTEQLPAELKIPLDQARADIQRAAQFLEGGKITREEYAARCQKIQQRFEYFVRQALKDRGEKSDEALLERLKRRLDQAQADAAASLPQRPGPER
jgi:hypothetical protein